MKKMIFVVFTAVLLSACQVERQYDASGNFEAAEITISAEATGRILALDIREGQEIIAGQKVGSIDSMQIYLSKLQLEKNILAVTKNRPDLQKQISALETQIRKQKTEQNRVQKLFNDGAATNKQLDDINAQIEILENQLEAQKSSLQNSVLSIDAQTSSIEMQIAQIEDKLAKCSVFSPISGTVLAKYVNVGEYVVTGKPLFKVADLHNIYMRAYLTSAQLSKIKIGQHVKIFADFGGNNTREYNGIIEWISSKSEFTPKNIPTDKELENIVYAVKITVKNDGYIKIGMYGRIKL